MVAQIKFKEGEARPFATRADHRFMRVNFMDVVEHKLKDDLDLSSNSSSTYNKPWINPLSPELRAILRIPKSRMRHFIYRGHHLPYVSNRLYNTTSLWFVLLMVNGLTHPQEIPPGFVMYYPSAQEMEKLVAKTVKSRKGEVVTV